MEHTRYSLSEELEVKVYGKNPRKAQRTFDRLKKKRRKKPKKTHRK
jgi:hypothetical protein